MNTKIESQRKLYCFERDHHARVAYLGPSLFVAIKNLDSPRYPRETKATPRDASLPWLQAQVGE